MKHAAHRPMPFLSSRLTLCARASAGFTLVELIAVIVILALLAVMGTTFVVSATESYRSTQTRALIVNTARPALERITRQVRGALPYSVRVVNSGSCVEFMPIAAGGNYTAEVPDSENLATPKSTISVSPYSVDFGTARYVSIGAMSAAELYGASASSRAGYSNASTSVQVVLSAAKQWLRNSINRRFYLLDNPSAFCVVSNELRLYESLDVSASSVDLSAAYSLMAVDVQAVQPFQLQQGSENRSTTLTISIVFASGGESMDFTQRVSIRNVP